MDDIIVVGIILLIVALALIYIIRAKKRGQKCIGCPASKSCASKKCNCNTEEDK